MRVDDGSRDSSVERARSELDICKLCVGASDFYVYHFFDFYIILPDVGRGIDKES